MSCFPWLVAVIVDCIAKLGWFIFDKFHACVPTLWNYNHYVDKAISNCGKQMLELNNLGWKKNLNNTNRLDQSTTL